MIHYLQVVDRIAPLNLNEKVSQQNRQLASDGGKVRSLSSQRDILKAVQLVHEFFHYLLFDFQIQNVVNCVPINKEGLFKIHH